jgi:hypothetical protein
LCPPSLLSLLEKAAVHINDIIDHARALNILYMKSFKDDTPTKPGTTKPRKTKTGTTSFEYEKAMNDQAWNDRWSRVVKPRMEK